MRKIKIHKIRRHIRNSPITFNFFIVVGIVLFCLWFFYKKPAEAQEEFTNNFQPLILLMAKVAILFFAAVVTLSILSTFLSWLLFRRSQKKGTSFLNLNLKEATMDKNIMRIQPYIQNILRPLLGFIAGRMILENDNYSEKFILSSNRKKGKTKSAFGTNALYFEDVKEYQIKGAYLYFEDMLRLCSLPVRQRLKESFYQPPKTVALEPVTVKPRSTEEMDVRIDQLRKVDGEYLHYKNFEYGDDPRRIVWKIYGKNRELIVRRPEIMNPYASHIYLYASFHTSFGENIQHSAYSDALLNYYKNTVWSLFRALYHNEDFEVKYISEQTVKEDEERKYEEKVQYAIANVNWQSYKNLQQYFNKSKGAVICISSFNDVKDVKELLDNISNEVVVHYCKLSNCFKDNSALTWVRKIFFLNPDNNLKNLKATWIFSPFRFQLQKNEDAIEALLLKKGIEY